jgi:hypothetical protein
MPARKRVLILALSPSVRSVVLDETPIPRENAHYQQPNGPPSRLAEARRDAMFEAEPPRSRWSRTVASTGPPTDEGSSSPPNRSPRPSHRRLAQVPRLCGRAAQSAGPAASRGRGPRRKVLPSPCSTLQFGIRHPAVPFRASAAVYAALGPSRGHYETRRGTPRGTH